MSQLTLAPEKYDEFWDEWGDFNRYHPGARHRRRKILSYLKKINFHSVLDVGCGSGEFLKIMQKNFSSVQKWAGADVSSSVINKNKNSIAFSDFFVLDLERESLNLKYDLLVCSEVIEHLQDRESAIKNLSKMVNSGGHLLITCPTGKLYPTEKYFGHVSHPTVSEMMHLAQIGGFKVEVIENWGWPFYKVLKVLTNINPQMSIGAFAKKKYSWFQKFISNVLYYVNFANISSLRLGCQFFILFKKI